jgi:hypothetical protein
MANKQTAVEWLYNQINFNGLDDPYGEVLEQAKQIEKEQMFEFAEQVLLNTECSFTGLPFMTTGYDNIYEETYGTN